MMNALPLYQCHKKVRASKIIGLAKLEDGTGIKLSLAAGICVALPNEWLSRNPAVTSGGYFVEYQEGDKYAAYSPAAPFEGGYTPIPDSKSASCGLNFGQAIKALKAGERVCRAGWNGKGLWLELQTPDAHSKMTLPYIFLNYPDDAQNTPGARVPWLASQTDVLAEDWEVPAC